MKTQILEKKGKLSSEKKFLACFFSHSRVWQTSRDNIWGFTRCFDIYCGSYSVNSVTPKKLLKTQLFEKKGKFSSEEKILANFLAHSGVWQTSVNTLYGPTKFFDNYCGSYRINSVTPKKLLKTQTFEKKRQTFKWKEFLACFFSHSRVWQTSRDNFWGSTRYYGNYCGSYRVNSVTHKKLLKRETFEKKRQTFEWKKFLACFISHSRVRQTSRDNFWGSTRYYGNYCGSYRVNSVTHLKLLKTQLWKKANFPVKRIFGLFYLAFSSVTNLKGQYMMAHKVFWQLLWKLQG